MPIYTHLEYNINNREEAVHRVGDWLLQVEKWKVFERWRQSGQTTPLPVERVDGDLDRGLILVFNTMVDIDDSGKTSSGNLTR